MKTKNAVRVVHIGDDVQTDDSRHKRLGDVIGIFFFLLLLFFFSKQRYDALKVLVVCIFIHARHQLVFVFVC